MFGKFLLKIRKLIEAVIGLFRSGKGVQPTGAMFEGIGDPTTGQTAAAEEALLRTNFLQAAEQGNARKLAALLDQRFLVNYQDPETGEAALHIAAACRARKVIRVLINTRECNFLLRDRQGRLASELAYLYGDDPVLARFLGIKEERQARAQGIGVTRRPVR